MMIYTNSTTDPKKKPLLGELLSGFCSGNAFRGTLHDVCCSSICQLPLGGGSAGFILHQAQRAFRGRPTTTTATPR